MAYSFPVNLIVEGRKCLIVGGGRVAERKLNDLLKCKAEVIIISPDITDKMREMLDRNLFVWKKRSFREDDVSKDLTLVISATDDKQQNEKIASICRRRKTLVNTVDAPSLCDFYVPSVVRNGNLSFSISTDGISPALSKFARKRLQDSFGACFSKYLKFISGKREEIKSTVKNAKLRRKLFKSFMSDKIFKLLNENKLNRVKKIINGTLTRAL